MIRLDYDGAKGCTERIKGLIDDLKTCATQISSSVNDLPNYWEGASATKAQNDYAEQYKNMIEKDIPEAMEAFRQFVEGSVETLLETDNQMAK